MVIVRVKEGNHGLIQYNKRDADDVFVCLVFGSILMHLLVISRWDLKNSTCFMAKCISFSSKNSQAS